MKNKITEETKLKIIELRRDGVTFNEIGRQLGIAASSARYHSDEEVRKESIRRAIKNRKPLTDEGKIKRREYFKEYQANRYKNDPEFRERIRRDNRENWRKKRGKQ